MSKEEGQAQEQPEVVDLHAAALRIIEADEPKEPEAEAAKPETEAPEATEPESSDAPPIQETKAEEARRLKLKYNGEEIEKLEPEVIELAQKGFDYTQKTQALAKEREELQQTIRSEIAAKSKAYEEKLQLAEMVIQQTLMPELQKTDWNALARDDPAQWAQKMQEANNAAAKLNAIQAERAQLAQMRAAEQQTLRQREVREAVETLQRDIPGWNDELYGKVLKFGVETGFKPEVVSAITDPVTIKVLHKAMQYDALQKGKPAVEKKVVNVPKVSKPGTVEKTDTDSDGKKQALARLRKSGSTDAAVEFAKHLL